MEPESITNRSSTGNTPHMDVMGFELVIRVVQTEEHTHSVTRDLKIFAENLFNTCNKKIIEKRSEFMKYQKFLLQKYTNKITEELELGPFISYKGNAGIPFLNLYRFEESFSVPLVDRILQKVGVSGSDYVLDPFCGCGTTLFTCVTRGIPSVGVDALPFARFMSETLPKFLFLEKNEIKDTWEGLLPTIQICEPAPVAADVPVMKVAFESSILMELRKMKTAIETLQHPYKDIFLFLFFSILEECSRTTKKKRYPVLVKDKKGKNPLDVMDQKVCAVEKDITRANYPNLRRECLPEVFSGDTTKASVAFARAPTVIITSPPYPDQIDYAKSYAVELCFHFVRTCEEFNAVRHQLLRSHQFLHLSEGEPPSHPAVVEAAAALKKSPDISHMLTAYFQDMEKVISTWYTVLRKNARAAVVVENLQYKGVLIPVDLILSDMAEEKGFTVNSILVANYKKTDRVLRESVLLWEK